MEKNKVWENEEEYLKYLEETKGYGAVGIISDKLKSKEFLLKAMKVDHRVISQAGDLLENKEFLMEAAAIDGEAVVSILQQEGKKLNNNKDILLVAAKSGANILEFVDDSELKHRDTDILLEVAKYHGTTATAYAHSDIENYREIVLTSVKQNGRALENLHCKGIQTELTNDEEVVMAAAENLRRIPEGMGEELKNNKEFMDRLNEMLEKQKEEVNLNEKEEELSNLENEDKELKKEENIIEENVEEIIN